MGCKQLEAFYLEHLKDFRKSRGQPPALQLLHHALGIPADGGDRATVTNVLHRPQARRSSCLDPFHNDPSVRNLIIWEVQPNASSTSPGRRCLVWSVGRVRQDEDVAHKNAHDLTRRRNGVLVSDHHNLCSVPTESSCSLGITRECRLETSSGHIDSVMSFGGGRDEVANNIDDNVQHVVRGVKMRVVAEKTRDTIAEISLGKSSGVQYILVAY